MRTNKTSIEGVAGATPKPRDFEKFWQERTRMLDQVELQYELREIRRYPRFRTYDLSFQSFDKATIHAKCILPETMTDCPCVLQFHGYPGSSRSFFELSAFAAKGFAVVAMDCRGQGGKSEDRGGIRGTTVSGHLIAGIDDVLEQMLYVKIFSDVYLISKIAAMIPGIDTNRIVANGASQGAALALVCGALNSNIRRIAALYPFLSDFKTVFEMHADTVAYEGLRYYSRWFDPKGERLDAFFERLGYIDMIHMAGLVQQDVLFGISQADMICLTCTQEAVYHNLHTVKRCFRYPGKGHETIHDFDDRASCFLIGQRYTADRTSSQSELYQDEMGIDRILVAGKKNLLLYFNEGEPVGSFYLDRFTVLDYDVVSFVGSIDAKRFRAYMDRKVKNRYHNVIAIGKFAGASAALDAAACHPGITGLVLQSPEIESQSVRSIRSIVSKLRCNGLFAYGGLESSVALTRYRELSQGLGDKFTSFAYPKYLRERINDFEDEIMDFLANCKI